MPLLRIPREPPYESIVRRFPSSWPQKTSGSLIADAESSSASSISPGSRRITTKIIAITSLAGGRQFPQVRDMIWVSVHQTFKVTGLGRSPYKTTRVRLPRMWMPDLRCRPRTALVAGTAWDRHRTNPSVLHLIFVHQTTTSQARSLSRAHECKDRTTVPLQCFHTDKGNYRGLVPGEFRRRHAPPRR